MKITGGLRRNQYVAKIKLTKDGVTVNDDANWRVAGFPPMSEHKIDKISVDPQTGATVIRLTLADEYATYRMFFDKGKVNELLPMVVATKDEISAYREEVYVMLGKAFFDGTPLATLSDGQKRALCMYANVTANGTKIGCLTYKENLYLTVDIGRDSNVYNDLKLNQVQRVAKVLNERLLAVLKAFTIPVKDEMNIYGLKLEMLIPHKNFLDENTAAFTDKLEIYAPIDLILKFAEADITSQEFIDGCVVIVESNRISVPLASY